MRLTDTWTQFIHDSHVAVYITVNILPSFSIHFSVWRLIHYTAYRPSVRFLSISASVTFFTFLILCLFFNGQCRYSILVTCHSRGTVGWVRCGRVRPGAVNSQTHISLSHCRPCSPPHFLPIPSPHSSSYIPVNKISNATHECLDELPYHIFSTRSSEAASFASLLSTDGILDVDHNTSGMTS